MTKIPKLFEIMQERGITPAKLSADTGISAGNISDWKSGRSKPSSERLAVLSKYLNVSTDYLLDNDPKEEPPLDKTDQEILVLARKTQELPEEDKKRFLEILRGSVNAFLKEDK